MLKLQLLPNNNVKIPLHKAYYERAKENGNKYQFATMAIQFL